MGIRAITKCRIALWCVLSVGVAAIADEQPYTTQASFIGGAGSTATNADFELISSWRQPIQTSLSSGGEYDNASGFLGALSDVSVAFRILYFGIATNPTPSFQLTIPTKPERTYAIQFADNAGDTFAWQSFANTNQAVGTYFETNSTPSTFTFTDDFTAATSGAPSSSARRFYRAMILEPPSTP
jgi:hypothetical protein